MDAGVELPEDEVVDGDLLDDSTGADGAVLVFELDRWVDVVLVPPM